MMQRYRIAMHQKTYSDIIREEPVPDIGYVSYFSDFWASVMHMFYAWIKVYYLCHMFIILIHVFHVLYLYNNYDIDAIVIKKIKLCHRCSLTGSICDVKFVTVEGNW